MRPVSLGLLTFAMAAFQRVRPAPEFRGTISGVITDPVAAMVSGAQAKRPHSIQLGARFVF